MAGTDPQTLAVCGWDPNRSTMFVNAGGTGGTPAVGARIGQINDLVGARHLDSADGVAGIGPKRKTDATLSRDYMEGTAADLTRLVTQTSDIGLSAHPYTIAIVFRTRSNTSGRHMTSARTTLGGVVGQTGGTALDMYAGAGGITGAVSDNVWHVGIFEFNGASSTEEVDGVTLSTGNTGTLGIPNNFSLFASYTTGISGSYIDADVMECWLINGLLSTNKAGVRTFLTAHATAPTAATTTIRRGGMGLGLGLGFSHGGGSSPTPAPSAADINSSADFLAAIRTASNTTKTVAAGVDLGTVDLSGEARDLSATPLSFVPFNRAGAKWKFTGTGAAPALNLSNWKGVTLDGFEAAHDEVGAGQTQYGIVKLNDTDHMSILSADIHGDATQGRHGSCRAIMAQRADNLTIEKNKIRRATWGFYGSGSNHIIRYNYFTKIQEHALHHEVGTVSPIIRYNLAEHWTAFWDVTWDNGDGTFGRYDDHGDFWIGFVTTFGGVVQTITSPTIEYNMVNQQGDHVVSPTSAMNGRPMGIYCDNEDFGAGPGVISSPSVNYNILMGCLNNHLFFNGATGGSATGNECYFETGSSEANAAFIRTCYWDGTWTGNTATLSVCSGSPAPTNGGSNVSGSSLDATAMDAKRDTFRATYPTIPAASGSD